MPIATENLPPNLKVLVDVLQSEPLDPAMDGLRSELAVLASRVQREDWRELPEQAAPVPHVLAFYVGRSFAGSGAFSVSVSGGGGGTLEDCPVKGCGHRRVKR